MALRVIPPCGSRPTGHGDWVGAGQVHTRSLGQPSSPWNGACVWTGAANTHQFRGA